jgi:cell division septation protein DedD
MFWMFTLGVIVGRGHSPVRFDIENIKNELHALREQALQEEAKGRASGGKVTPDEMSFDFYEALTDKKEAARVRSVQEALEEPTESSASAEAEAPVKVETTPSEEESRERRPSRPTAMKTKIPLPFVVQVASLKDSAKATELVTSLKLEGYTAYSVKVRIPEKGTYYRVRVGHFENRRHAGQILAKLRQQNPQLDPMIIRE